MTIDDDNSIYVGGLPYDATEDTLRHDFSFFGSVVAVKIINDREVGGKCYGFITFTNPRSAIHAIEDMNGRTIGGRVVRVSEVRTRGGKPSFHGENFRRDDGRDIDWDRDNDREKDYVRDRDRYRGRYTERSRERERERGKDYERGRDSDREIDHTFDRGRDMEEHDRERTRENDRDWERGRDVNWSRDREMDKAKEHDGGRDNDKEQQSRNRFSARVTDRHSRESSSDSDDVSQGQVKEQLEMSIQIHEDLESELCLIQAKMNEKEQLVSDLQKKYQKLEDALADARKLTTQRELVLTKLHRCFMQTQEYNLRLKSSEQELQLLVDTEMDDTGVADDTNTRNGSAYANGQARVFLRQYGAAADVHVWAC